MKIGLVEQQLHARVCFCPFWSVHKSCCKIKCRLWKSLSSQRLFWRVFYAMYNSDFLLTEPLGFYLPEFPSTLSNPGVVLVHVCNAGLGRAPDVAKLFLCRACCCCGGHLLTAWSSSLLLYPLRFCCLTKVFCTWHLRIVPYIYYFFFNLYVSFLLLCFCSKQFGLAFLTGWFCYCHTLCNTKTGFIRVFITGNFW